MKRSWLLVFFKKKDSSSVWNEPMLSDSLYWEIRRGSDKVVHPADLKARISLFEQWFILPKNTLK